MEDDPKDHEVGYGRPPKHTQFKAGTSGNPKGRPKGSLNLMNAIMKELLIVSAQPGATIRSVFTYWMFYANDLSTRT